jgi:hypothetical protein
LRSLAHFYYSELEEDLIDNRTSIQDTPAEALVPTQFGYTLPESLSENNLVEPENSSPPTSSIPGIANSAREQERIYHNPPVTIEEWPDPDDEWGLNNEFLYDGLQIPPEDLHRTSDDLYACGHDINDQSKAAQQFSEWTDQQLRNFLQEELGSEFMREWETICE